MLSIKILYISVTLRYMVDVNGFDLNRECCPPQEIFSINNNSRCSILHYENSLKNYEAINKDWGMEYLQKCFSDTLTKFSIINSTIPKSITCSDVLRNNDLINTSFIYYCKQNNKNNKAVPQLKTIRKCCPPEQRYDIGTRECINFTSNNFTILETLNKFTYNTIDFLSIIKGHPTCNYSIMDHTINVVNDRLIFNNDTLQVNISSNNRLKNIFTNENNACFDFGLSSNTLVVRTCNDDLFCKQNICLRKCCQEDEAWIGHQCQKLSSYHGHYRNFHTEIKKFIKNTYHNSILSDILNSTVYGLMVGQQFCNSRMYPIKPEENWYFTSRGYIHVPDQDTYDQNEYCLEMIYEHEEYSDGLYPCLCFNDYLEQKEEISPKRFAVNAALELISCTFLLATFLIYLCLPLLQNLHGKTLMCHVASLFIAYACHVTITLMSLQVTTDNNYILNSSICKPLGYAMIASFLASFSWLSIMCFDIWWTFGGCSGTGYISNRRKARRKRFFFYSCFAWGLPLSILLITITIDQTKIIAKHLRPNIGIEACWFDQNRNSYGEIIYFFGPVSFLLTINIIFFILTIRNCNHVKADISKFLTTDIKNRRFQADKTKLILNIRLFILMGISWIFETISYAINHCAPNLSWRVELFYVFDVFNCLRGVIIFVLFVFKSKVYYALMHLLGRRRTDEPTSKRATNLQHPNKMTTCTSCSTLMSSTIDPFNSQI
ncbi:G-protein coupled receptor Mth2 [Microplitis demolitor]|uniref:G-protein coupled receptor Mth2 n=1 Tax=Microplitis demolitor TaxID=69319 RepID=UPI0004CCE7CA|nr:G-protein coupled receptor Mth2 [Microplitis demolitor]